jgi:hypothetical protein
MNQRVTGWLLALYPRSWRDRYGAEVASLTEELIRAGETRPLPAGLNLVAGAAVERARALAGSRTALVVSSAAVIVALVAGGFVITGYAQPSQAPGGTFSASCLAVPPLQVTLSQAPPGRPRPPEPSRPTVRSRVGEQTVRGLSRAEARTRAGELSRLGRPPQPGPVAVTLLAGRPGLRISSRLRGLSVSSRLRVLRVSSRVRALTVSPRGSVLAASSRPRDLMVPASHVRRGRPAAPRFRPTARRWISVPSRDCLSPSADQVPVVGRAPTLRVRPPVPAVTRVTR